MKNYDTIDKIISELALKDCKTANAKKGPLKKSKPYLLSHETLEALEIKRQYANDEITEESYEAYCLKYNLISR